MSTNDKSAEGKEISQSLLAPEQIGELLIEYLHSNQPLTAAIRAHLTGDQACVEQRLQPTPSDERPVNTPRSFTGLKQKKPPDTVGIRTTTTTEPPCARNYLRNFTGK